MHEYDADYADYDNPCFKYLMLKTSWGASLPHLPIIEMPPIARHEIDIEESIYKGVTHAWAWLSYMVRQVVILIPCLWAGYDRGRRKEERMKNPRRKKPGRKTPAKQQPQSLNDQKSNKSFYIKTARVYWVEGVQTRHEEEKWDWIV